MEHARRKAGVIVAIALVAFGVSQYVAATGIAVSVTGSEFVESNAAGSTYDLSISVSNPTLFPINVGDTEFAVSEGGKVIGSGVIESFVMPIMGSAVVEGAYFVDSGASQNSADVRISGTTEYNLLFVSVSIPFEYDTVDGFIHEI